MNTWAFRNGGCARSSRAGNVVVDRLEHDGLCHEFHHVGSVTSHMGSITWAPPCGFHHVGSVSLMPSIAGSNWVPLTPELHPSSQLLPLWLVSVSLALLLTAITWKLWHKGIDTFRSENRRKRGTHLPHNRAASVVKPGDADSSLSKPLLESPASSGMPALTGADLRAVSVSSPRRVLIPARTLTRSRSLQDGLLRIASFASGAAADWVPDVDELSECSSDEPQDDLADVEALEPVGEADSSEGHGPGAAQALAGLIPFTLRACSHIHSLLPMDKFSLLMALAAWVVATDMLKDQLLCGSLAYWGVVLSVVPAAFVVTLFVRHRLLRARARDDALGLPPHVGELAEGGASGVLPYQTRLVRQFVPVMNGLWLSSLTTLGCSYRCFRVKIGCTE